MTKSKIKKGFTLIELLVVVAIISLLASVVFASLNSARAKARDAKRISEFNQISKALALYYDKYGYMPVYNDSTCCSGDHVTKFNNMAQELVTLGFLSKVPVAQAGSVYYYYNYGSNQIVGGVNVGALLVTTLEAAPDSLGYPATCRPWAGSNWCRSDVASKQYCLCNSH